MSRSFVRPALLIALATSAVSLQEGCGPASMPGTDAGVTPDAAMGTADAFATAADAFVATLPDAFVPPMTDAAMPSDDAPMPTGLVEVSSLTAPSSAASAGYGTCVVFNQVSDVLVVSARDATRGTATFLEGPTLATVSSVDLPSAESAESCAIDYGMDWGYASTAVTFASRTERVYLARTGGASSWSLLGRWSAPAGRVDGLWPESLEGGFLYADRPSHVSEVRLSIIGGPTPGSLAIDPHDVGTYDALNPIVVDSIDRAWINRTSGAGDTIALPDGTTHTTGLAGDQGVVAFGASSPTHGVAPLLACSAISNECVLQLYRTDTWALTSASAPFSSRELVYAQHIATNGRWIAVGSGRDAFLFDTTDTTLAPQRVTPTPPSMVGATTYVDAVALSDTQLFVGLASESRVAVFNLP